MSDTTNAPQAQATEAPKPVGKWPALVERMAGTAELEPAQYWGTIKALCGLATAPNEVVVAFLLTAKKYDLDPMVKQIYAFEKNGKIIPIVPIDGWLKIINDHPQFDGMEFDDIFSAADKDGKSKILSVSCKIHRKDRRYPVIVTEYLSECDMGTQPWQKWPVRMLRHKAMIQAARYAFGLGGIYDPDEAERIRKEQASEDAKHESAQVLSNITSHLHDVAASGTSMLAKTANASFEEAKADTDQQTGEPPSDWEAVYDELVPGIENAATPLALTVFLEENADMINKMGVQASARIVEKWLALVEKRKSTFPKK